MGAMYRLKAYFGMVPAEEMGEYADELADRYSEPRRERSGPQIGCSSLISAFHPNESRQLVPGNRHVIPRYGDSTLRKCGSSLS